MNEIAKAFDLRAANYARNQWHCQCAERLVALCEFRPGSRVLDACTGTGFAAIAAARAVGTEGYVSGLDISSGMLREAQIAVEASGFDNIKLELANATSLSQYRDQTFDVVICAAGLLYLNVEQALQEWFRILRDGGMVAFTSMQAGSPRAGQLFRDCAAEFGISLRDPSDALGSERACGKALVGSGFSRITVVCESIQLSPQDLTLAWESNFNSPAHAAVRLLSEFEQHRLRAKFLSELTKQARAQGEPLSRADVLFARGIR